MDQGFIFLIILCVLVVVAWGGLRLYTYLINKEIASLQANIDSLESKITGEKVDRVMDTEERLGYIAKANDSKIDTTALFAQLEKLTVPEVTLTKYEYDNIQKVVLISGTTSNFRFIAQQIINFRSESPLEDIQVEKLGTTKEGRIPFTLKALLSQ